MNLAGKFEKKKIYTTGYKVWHKLSCSQIIMEQEQRKIYNFKSQTFSLYDDKTLTNDNILYLKERGVVAS